MLYDAALDRAALPTSEDRRASLRTPHRAELVVQWHHDPDSLVRYRVLDRGDGGFRLLSSLPLATGLSGLALRLLPEGRQLDHSVMVAWCRAAGSGTGYEVGITFIRAL